MLPRRPYSPPPKHIPKPGYPPRPIPNSYWPTPFLLACEYPFDRVPAIGFSKLDPLLAAGIRTFIDLTHPDELKHYLPYIRPRASAVGIPETEDISYHRITIQDGGVPQNKEIMETILGLLEQSEKMGRKAAVHCWGGIGRTGTVVGCWLVRSGRAKDGSEALDMVAEEWKTVEKARWCPRSPETAMQVTYVKNFGKQLDELESGDTEIDTTMEAPEWEFDLGDTTSMTGIVRLASKEDSTAS